MADSFTYLRQFAPEVIKTLQFRGGDAGAELLVAVAMLRELYVRGGRNVPPGAPTSFVPARWRGYLSAAAEERDPVAYRHYWQLCVLLGLRDALRAGDVWVPGSRRYADPTTILMPPMEWDLARAEFCALVGAHPSADERSPRPTSNSTRRWERSSRYWRPGMGRCGCPSRAPW